MGSGLILDDLDANQCATIPGVILTDVGLTGLFLGFAGLAVIAFRSPDQFRSLRSRRGAALACLAAIGFLILLVKHLVNQDWLQAGLTASAMIALASLVFAVVRARVSRVDGAT